MPQKVGDLEISQELGWERRQWTVELLARAVLALLVLAALLGAFGPGPFSWSEEDAGELTARYERFTRRGGTSALEVHVRHTAAEAGEFQVRIERQYMAGFTIESITPTPDSVDVNGRWLVYSFTVADANEGLVAEFALTPEGLWSVGGQVSLPNGDSVAVRHFVYP